MTRRKKTDFTQIAATVFVVAGFATFIATGFAVMVFGG